MKQEFDQEMDTLLRRSARFAAAAGPRGAEGARDAYASSHLDADEMSAFAENALPASARVAAATHLADCDECRGMVVQLVSAAGVAEEIEKRAAAAPVVPVEAPWWKSLFGSLFAPGMLRYMAPVLVLGLVGVFSIIALRPWQGSTPATVYQPNEARDANNVATEPATPAQQETTSTTAPPNLNATAPGNAPTDAGKGGLISGAAEKAGTAPSVSQPATTDSAEGADKDLALADRPAPVETGRKAGPSAEDEAKKKEDADALRSNTVASPAPPPIAKSAGTEVVEQPKGARGNESTRNKEPEENSYIYREQQQVEANRAAQRSRQGEITQMPDGGSQRGDSRAMNNRGNVGGGYPNTTPSTRAERAPAAKRRAPEDNKVRDGAGEDDEVARVDSTRSVAGRRFRREGNAWVDVNYKPSMSMTGVRRGTDSFRALVADIPELGRIAEQLGGEVIAVVRGRAYRIR